MNTKSFVLLATLAFSTTTLAENSPTASGLSEPGYLNYDFPRASDSQRSRSTDYIDERGAYEPGYLNYDYPSDRTTERREPVIGKELASGAFEPGYLNHCYEHADS